MDANVHILFICRDSGLVMGDEKVATATVSIVLGTPKPLMRHMRRIVSRVGLNDL